MEQKLGTWVWQISLAVYWSRVGSHQNEAWIPSFPQAQREGEVGPAERCPGGGFASGNLNKTRALPRTCSARSPPPLPAIGIYTSQSGILNGIAV